MVFRDINTKPRKLYIMIQVTIRCPRDKNIAALWKFTAMPKVEGGSQDNLDDSSRLPIVSKIGASAFDLPRHTMAWNLVSIINGVEP
jgi:hypothetical protein